MPLQYVPTSCAICGGRQDDRELYPSSVREERLSGARFSARIEPDGLHYRMVRCARCRLVRSDPILADEELARLYGESTFEYDAEATFAGATYVRYLKKCLPLVPSRGRLLEIGCGNGFFLDRALDCGFSEVHGVEPGHAAIARAPERVRGKIREGLFGEGMFPDEHFDLVCAFQVLDHVARPNELLGACRRALKPGGVLLLVNHDVDAWTNRLLGEKSPIIDVEHIYLYGQRTMARLLEKNGFEHARVFTVRNSYPIKYWARLAPLPRAVKRPVLSWLETSSLGATTATLAAGNLGAIARRG